MATPQEFLSAAEICELSSSNLIYQGFMLSSCPASSCWALQGLSQFDAKLFPQRNQSLQPLEAFQLRTVRSGYNVMRANSVPSSTTLLCGDEIFIDRSLFWC
jgi:hypothetical protein